VALQHAIRDLRNEIENLRAERNYASLPAFAGGLVGRLRLERHPARAQPDELLARQDLGDVFDADHRAASPEPAGTDHEEILLPAAETLDGAEATGWSLDRESF
jgi:hypothetical protein